MKKEITILIFALLTGIIFAQTGSITIISAAQRTDGSMLVDIYYDLNGPELPYRIKAEASFDGGTSFSSLTLVSGDTGPGVSPGTGKHIVWDFGDEFPGSYNPSTQIRLTANYNCGDVLVDERDGQSYNTVQIGTQCWMAENLNIGTMIQGAEEMTNNEIMEKYCYDNNTANCDVYGGLYQWNEMMQYTTSQGTQGLCPVGWHIPIDYEWCTLTLYIDPTVNCDTLGFSGTDVGTKMKSTTGWNSGGNGTNASGFTALPGGYRVNNPIFYSLGDHALFWSCTVEYPDQLPWHRTISYNEAIVLRYYGTKDKALSVRCIHN